MHMTPRLSAALYVAGLLGALLACGGGGKSQCTAQVDYDGKQASGRGEGLFAARHDACREWCRANDPASASSDGHAACASRCGADILFEKASASVACQ
jgi:hypothetical protein